MWATSYLLLTSEGKWGPYPTSSWPQKVSVAHILPGNLTSCSPWRESMRQYCVHVWVWDIIVCVFVYETLPFECVCICLCLCVYVCIRLCMRHYHVCALWLQVRMWSQSRMSHNTYVTSWLQASIPPWQSPTPGAKAVPSTSARSSCGVTSHWTSQWIYCETRAIRLIINIKEPDEMETLNKH